VTRQVRRHANQTPEHGLARISHRAVRCARGKVMINRYLQRVDLDTSEVHTEPIAALAALKLASLALPSTHS